jgi:hypothetical protein
MAGSRKTSSKSLIYAKPPSKGELERARKRGIEEIDRDGVIQHPAHAGRRHRPPIGAAILIKPAGHLRMASAETIRRHGHPDPHRKAPLGRGDYFARIAGHLCVPILFQPTFPHRLDCVQSLGSSVWLGYGRKIRLQAALVRPVDGLLPKSFGQRRAGSDLAREPEVRIHLSPGESPLRTWPLPQRAIAKSSGLNQ